MTVLRYNQLITETLINPFDHPYVIINKELEILGHCGDQGNPVFALSPVTGKKLPEVLHPELIDEVKQAFEQCCQGQTEPGSFREITGGFHTRLQIIPAPFEIHKNRFICFFEVLSKRQFAPNKGREAAKRSHPLYRHSENIFYQAFHSAPIPLAIARVDDCTLMEVNQALLKKVGCTREELIGFSALKLGFWQNGEDPINIAKALKNQCYLHNFEVSFTLKNHQEIHTLLNLDLVELNGDQCLLAIIQDITHIKQTEAKLKENQHLLSSINENLNEGIYRSTPEHGFVYMNKAFASMFGFTVEEAMNISPEQLYANEQDRERVRRRLANDGHLKNEQVEFLKKDGSTFWGFLSSTLSRDSKGNYIYDGAVVDISDLRRSKVLLHQKNDELKKINEELDRFVYSASHDLRAPLSSMLGLVNVALMETSNDKVVGYLDMIKESVNKLDGLISDIINFSRNARLELSPEAVDFEALARETFDHLKYLPQADTIRTEIKINQSTAFYSDPKRLGILLNNLISNGFRYHDSGKDTPFIKLEINAQPKVAEIQVSDNGIGVHGDHIESIFDMFFRASTDSEGSGLGLYIVKETVEKLDGHISVESKVGEGTTFLIRIPNLKPLD